MREDPTDNRDNAVAIQVVCEHCNLTGQVVIYHPSYDGSPTVKVVNDRGAPITIPSRAVAHCTCMVGKWMRRRTEIADCIRTPDLADVLSGRLKWLTYDPTRPDLDAAKMPRGDWRAIFRMVGASAGVVAVPAAAKKFPRIHDDPIIERELQSQGKLPMREPGDDG